MLSRKVNSKRHKLSPFEKLAENLKVKKAADKKG